MVSGDDLLSSSNFKTTTTLRRDSYILFESLPGILAWQGAGRVCAYEHFRRAKTTTARSYVTGASDSEACNSPLPDGMMACGVSDVCGMSVDEGGATFMPTPKSV